MAVFTLALALSLAAPAPQEFTELQKDVRCVVALQAMASSLTDEVQKGALGGIMLFYMGRLSVQLAPPKIESAINDVGQTVDPNQHRQLALDCIERMKKFTGIT